MIDILLKFPKGIEELTTVFALLGFLLFLLSMHVRPLQKWMAVLLLLFFIAWRFVFSNFKVISSRYVSGLIIPSLLFSFYFFFKLQKTKSNINKCVVIVFTAVLLMEYIKEDVKFNKYDANYYAIAEIAKDSDKKKEAKVFLTDDDDFERILYLSNTNNINKKSRTYLPYNNNFGYSYYPLVVDIDSNTSFPLRDNKKCICSFSPRKNAKKRINLILSSPKSSLITNPVSASRDIEGNILQNGTIEEIDTSKESYRKFINQVSNYSLFFEYDESIRTPKNVFFKVVSGNEKKMTLGINSESPINGSHSASIKFNNGNAFLLFGQQIHSGEYHYSFLIQGKPGTRIQPVYRISHNNKLIFIPICLFTVPDSRTYLISTTFATNELKGSDSFIVGVELQKGEAQFDDFILVLKEH